MSFYWVKRIMAASVLPGFISRVRIFSQLPNYTAGILEDKNCSHGMKLTIVEGAG